MTHANPASLPRRRVVQLTPPPATDWQGQARQWRALAFVALGCGAVFALYAVALTLALLH